MAVLKHLSSKSSDYEKALEYLMYQHNEMTQEPIRNDRGQMMLREEFYLDGLNCSPSSFAKECELLNRDFHKNQKYSEVKSHHYILSFDPRDIQVARPVPWGTTDFSRMDFCQSANIIEFCHWFYPSLSSKRNKALPFER